jgi:hypothetical protein
MSEQEQATWKYSRDYYYIGSYQGEMVVIITCLLTQRDVFIAWAYAGHAVTQWGTCFMIEGVASEVTKIRHDVTFPLLT